MQAIRSRIQVALAHEEDDVAAGDLPPCLDHLLGGGERQVSHGVTDREQVEARLRVLGQGALGDMGEVEPGTGDVHPARRLRHGAAATNDSKLASHRDKEIP